MITEELATFGGGCFWCLEAVFERLPGVISVTSGYAGGHVDYPTYENVCTKKTGHAEVIQIAFDSKTISFTELLHWFWRSHDPTTHHRQGADVGPQYRSIVLYHSPEQKLLAEQSIAEVTPFFSQPIVTELKALERFFPAEGYHQDYFRRNPDQGYCQFVVVPKLQKLFGKR